MIKKFVEKAIIKHFSQNEMFIQVYNNIAKVTYYIIYIFLYGT